MTPLTSYTGAVHRLSPEDTYEGLQRMAAEARQRQRETRRDPRATAAARRKRIIARCEIAALVILGILLLLAAANPGWPR